MKKEVFNEAKIKLKCTCSYQKANHTDKLFTKDELGNTVEDWDFYVSNQQDKDTKSIWFTLIARDKNNDNVTQIDFSDIPKRDLYKFITDLVNLYKDS